MRKISFLSSILLFMLLFSYFTGMPDACLAADKPTAIVVDADTNEPIDGAAAIAIWRKSGDAAWFEGGGAKVVKIEEALSDREGKIFIKGFWNWHLIKMEYPRLTVYKSGYICWDQQYIFGNPWINRTDFNKEYRTIRMKKRPENFSFIKHDHFVDSCTYYDSREAKTQLGLFKKEYEKDRGVRHRKYMNLLDLQ
jgi:hypothetical protein